MAALFNETISNLDSLDKISKKISILMKPQTLWLIDGDLGAGKTTLVTQVLSDLGYNQASSPTYALRHTYENVKVDAGTLKVEHIDLYRLKDEEDIDSMGLWDVFTDTKNIVIIEWASRVPPDQWPLNWKIFTLKILKENDQRSYFLSTTP